MPTRARAAAASTRQRRAFSISKPSSCTRAAKRSSSSRQRLQTSCKTGVVTSNSTSKRVRSWVASSTSCWRRMRFAPSNRSSSRRRSIENSLASRLCLSSSHHDRCAAHRSSTSAPRRRKSPTSASASRRSRSAAGSSKRSCSKRAPTACEASCSWRCKRNSVSSRSRPRMTSRVCSANFARPSEPSRRRSRSWLCKMFNSSWHSARLSACNMTFSSCSRPSANWPSRRREMSSQSAPERPTLCSSCWSSSRCTRTFDSELSHFVRSS
mmetsp:Transcript_13340/g.35794  ORF Transcript_13340/g.35794 Transcript_13340/m.35794 type:complete len:268 (-) Transcript_13340:685-1488(-)